MDPSWVTTSYKIVLQPDIHALRKIGPGTPEFQSLKRRVRELQSILIGCSGKIYSPSQENVREFFRDISLETGKEAYALFLAGSTSISDLVPANVKDVKFLDIKSWWDEEEKMVDWKPLLDTLRFIKAPIADSFVFWIESFRRFGQSNLIGRLSVFELRK